MLCALQYDTVIVEVSIAFFVHCVITHHIAVILTCSSFQDSEDPDFFACAEHIGTIMLSLGSLHHERCDPVRAAAAYRQAGRILGIACQAVQPGSTAPATELSRMLACAWSTNEQKRAKALLAHASLL